MKTVGTDGADQNFFKLRSNYANDNVNGGTNAKDENFFAIQEANKYGVAIPDIWFGLDVTGLIVDEPLSKTELNRVMGDDPLSKSDLLKEKHGNGKGGNPKDESTRNKRNATSPLQSKVDAKASKTSTATLGSSKTSLMASSKTSSVHHDSGQGKEPVFAGIMKYLESYGSNGVILNKVLVWMDIQHGITGAEIWKSQAISNFTLGELLQAKTSLFETADRNII